MSSSQSNSAADSSATVNRLIDLELRFIDRPRLAPTLHQLDPQSTVIAVSEFEPSDSGSDLGEDAFVLKHPLVASAVFGKLWQLQEVLDASKVELFFLSACKVELDPEIIEVVDKEKSNAGKIPDICISSPPRI